MSKYWFNSMLDKEEREQRLDYLSNYSSMKVSFDAKAQNMNEEIWNQYNLKCLQELAQNSSIVASYIPELEKLIEENSKIEKTE
jgi:hypothetical protein